METAVICPSPSFKISDELTDLFLSYVGSSFPTRILKFFDTNQTSLIFILGRQVPVDLLPLIAQLLRDDRHWLSLVIFL